MNASSPTGLPDFDTLWDYDRPAETEARFRDLLPAAQASGDRDYHLQLLTQVARAQGLQRNYDGAHATLDHVRDLMTDDLTTARVRHLLERGRCFNDQGNHERARACFLEAWDVAREKRLDDYAVDAAHMMGIIERPAGAALEWNLRAMEYAKGSEEPGARRWLASLQNNIGWTLFGMGRHGEALALFEEALELRRQNGRPGPIRIARYSVGKAQRALGRVAEALADQEALLRECELAGEPDGYVHEEVAECLLALGRAAEARPHFARAHELLSKDPWFPAEEKGRLERMAEMGGALSSRGSFDDR
jgi:tetratricopeptide (TPR) repeat protein